MSSILSLFKLGSLILPIEVARNLDRNILSQCGLFDSRMGFSPIPQMTSHILPDSYNLRESVPSQKLVIELTRLTRH